MRPAAHIRAELSRVGATADDEIDLAGTALVLASAAQPRVLLESYRRHLARLVDDVGTYAKDGAPINLRAEALSQIIAGRYGYGGDDAVDDLAECANLTRVIDRRSGLPVSLGIIYIHVARALDWPISGIDFPGRFLVRLQEGGRRDILDPFDGGRVMEPEDLRGLLKMLLGNDAELDPRRYRSMGNRDILLRLQNNVKAGFLSQERLDRALETVETTLLFVPDGALLWREAGLLHARLDSVRAAVAALEEYMRRNTGDSARYRTSVLLQELRGRGG